MKSLRSLLSVVMLSIAGTAFAQSEAHKAATVPPSEAQKAFTQLKNLAGSWQGAITVDPPQPEMKNGGLGKVSLRVTSRGNALVHEMMDPTKADDPTRYDHPVTMFYLDGDRLLLTH